VALLLDTHALLWWLAEPNRLSPAAHGAIADPGNRVHVSAASGWEIATKVRLGKLPVVSELLDDLPHLLAAQGFEPLPVSLLHGLHAGRADPGEPRSSAPNLSLRLALVEPSHQPWAPCSTEDDRVLLDRAATALGTDRSSFLLAQGRLAVQRVLADRQHFLLDADAQQEWDRINKREACSLPGLTRLVERPSPFAQPGAGEGADQPQV